MSEDSPVSRAEAVELPPGPERRRTVRFECKRRNSWRLFAAGSCSSGKGTVNDISVSGINLTVDSALRPGMFLKLSLSSADEQDLAQPVLVRVRRVTPHADGSWLVGCTFVKRLSKQELSGWL